MNTAAVAIFLFAVAGLAIAGWIISRIHKDKEALSAKIARLETEHQEVVQSAKLAWMTLGMLADTYPARFAELKRNCQVRLAELSLIERQAHEADPKRVAAAEQRCVEAGARLKYDVGLSALRLVAAAHQEFAPAIEAYFAAAAAEQLDPAQEQALLEAIQRLMPAAD